MSELMRVALCVDALAPELGGIGRYTWELCKGLSALDELNVRFYGRNRLIDDPAVLVNGGQLARRRRGLRKLTAWRERNSMRNDIVHGPNYFLPAFAERGVITVHDLSVFKYPETHPPERLGQFNQEFHRSLGRARHIITDTETVRAELISDFNVAPDIVTAVHLGVDDRFRMHTEETLRNVLTPLGLKPKSYGLCVSTLEPRKKIIELLAAWRRLPLGLRDQYPLVLAGGAGWLNNVLGMEIERGMAEGWLRHLGFVGEDLLPALYAGARVFVYPSIYEGFGLPPLEAMASGTPVIVASRSCLPEVCGDAASYVDPEDPDEMRSCLIEGLTDEDWQLAAARRGLARSSGFSWDRCIEGTVSVYRKAAGTS